jgi:biotin transport system ATP-binding protein
MITVHDIAFAYPHGEPVLHGVSLAVQAGALVGLVGANGSGKSTLLSLLAGLHEPATGSIDAFGVVSPGQAKALRATLRLVVQEPDLHILGATVVEDLMLGADPRDESARESAVAMAARFGLGERLEDPVQTLSFGQKRKLCLAGTLLAEPRGLLLDEPFSGLDFPGMREMRAILKANRERGVTQVVSAHDLEPFADLADAWVVLDAGRVAASGGHEEVFPCLRAHGVRPPASWTLTGGLEPWEEE